MAALRVESQGGFLGGALGFGLGVAGAVIGGEAHADGFGNAEFFHGHAVHHVGAGHGALGVGDDDELAVVDETIEHFDKAVDVRFVERGVEFVEHAEGAGLDHVDREQEGDGGHRALTTREKGDGLELFARRLDGDFDAGFEGVVGVDEVEVGLAFFAEELLEHLAEVDADLGEGFGEQALGLGVDALDDFQQLGLGVDEVVVLVLEEIVAFFELVEFFDGVEVDGAHGVEAALDVGYD